MQPGDKLAHYEVIEKIGAGGMGEVFRGKDTKLGRDVALKVLPTEFASDPDRLAREMRPHLVLLDRHLPDGDGLEVCRSVRSSADEVLRDVPVLVLTAKREQEDRARHLLALVGLEGFEDKRPSELSGGMRQRASLCRSIVHKPEVLILDEPFGALDAFTREDLWQTMHKVKAEEPFTGVLITHDLRESIFLADQVIVLSGRPARTQYVMDVHLSGERDLEHLYTAESAEALNILRHQIKVAQGRADGMEAAE